MAGWAMYLWNEWSIQILVLISFTLQVFIFLFAGMRQRNSRAWRLLLWLAYLLAETTALYALGHISNSKLPELRPAAFWAQFLLLHLGGPDTMTAYALQDNQLWLRHLLTLVLQALGAAYLLYRHIADSGTLLVMAAVLVYLLGIMKYGERVWTLKSSGHDGIINFLVRNENELRENGVFLPVDDTEDVLRDAHQLLHICMGQFVDYKIGISGPLPGPRWTIFTKYRSEKGPRLFELIGMQLSLMHDILYTKALVIHTWYGFYSRAVSLVATVTALLLFRFKAGKDGYTRADVAITYTMLGGAIVLEMTSILRAIGSSWTCAICILRKEEGDDINTDINTESRPNPSAFARYKKGILDGLHSGLMFFRRLFKSAEQHGRKWSGSVGQHDLLDAFTMKQDFSSRIARIAGLEKWLNKLRMTGTVDISDDHKRLMLDEIGRIARACNGKEHMMWTYRGQCVLQGWAEYSGNLTRFCTDIAVDESILAWHFATNLFLRAINKEDPAAAGSSSSQQLHHAIKVLSNYMMFLLVEHPYMLPSPVRATNYDLAYSRLLREGRNGHFEPTSPGIDLVTSIVNRILKRQSGGPPILRTGAELAEILLRKQSDQHLPRVILGVWVEMLCYAASHCSRDSHARQLNGGAELITIIWILQSFF